MSGVQILILVLLSAFAVYRQSIRQEVIGRTRFKMATMYAVAALIVGGFYLPPDVRSWFVAGASLVLSVVVGVIRGRLTQLHREPSGRVFSQGTVVTIGLSCCSSP